MLADPAHVDPVAPFREDLPHGLVGGHDAALLIDPVITYSTYLGGSGETSFKRSGAWAEQTAPVAGEPVTVAL